MHYSQVNMQGSENRIFIDYTDKRPFTFSCCVPFMFVGSKKCMFKNQMEKYFWGKNNFIKGSRFLFLHARFKLKHAHNISDFNPNMHKVDYVGAQSHLLLCLIYIELSLHEYTNTMQPF